MEIIGTNMSEKQQKNKKLIKIISIIIVMLMLISVVLAATIFVLKEKQFKFIVDDQNIAQTEGMFIIETNVRIIVLVILYCAYIVIKIVSFSWREWPGSRFDRKRFQGAGGPG